jgi:hypothetical protein
MWYNGSPFIVSMATQLSYRDERACGPLPPADLCWLDLKGCFLEGETIYSRKDPFDRARDIYEMGYT